MADFSVAGDAVNAAEGIFRIKEVYVKETVVGGDVARACIFEEAARHPKGIDVADAAKGLVRDAARILPVFVVGLR